MTQFHSRVRTRITFRLPTEYQLITTSAYERGGRRTVAGKKGWDLVVDRSDQNDEQGTEESRGSENLTGWNLLFHSVRTYYLAWKVKKEKENGLGKE